MTISNVLLFYDKFVLTFVISCIILRTTAKLVASSELKTLFSA